MSRFCSLIANNIKKSFHFLSNRRFCFYEKESIHPPLPSPQIPESISPPLVFRDKFRLIKFGIFSVFLGTAVTAGYATYTYTADQVDALTKEFRQRASMITTEDDASTLEKYKALLCSAAMTVPANCIDAYLYLMRSIREIVQDITDPILDKLLPDMDPQEQILGVKTIVLDLNETLICCNWKREGGWKIFKRPGLDVFLDTISEFFEVVIYTDMMADDISRIVRKLNRGGAIVHVLSRSCTKYQNGKYYRDLSKLNRDPSRVIYISGHALENALQQENCAPIKPWKLEQGDTTLIDLLPFLEFVARQGRACPDLRQILQSYKGTNIPTEFAKRQREMLEKPKKRSARLLEG